MSMSREQPIATLSVLSAVGGVIGYTKAGSVPSLAAGVGISAVMAVASMRIHDGLTGGLELATASSATMMVPMLRRALRTRGPVPIVMSLLSAASTGFYAHETYEQYETNKALK